MYELNLEPNLLGFGEYQKAQAEFRPLIPERFNIASAIFERHPDYETRVALIEKASAANNTYTFGALNYLSTKLAVALRAAGVSERDRVPVILPQSAALAVTHAAVFKLGAILVPLVPSLDREALATVFKACEPAAIIGGVEARGKIEAAAADLLSRTPVFITADQLLRNSLSEGEINFWRAVYDASCDFKPRVTSPDTPALLLYDAERADIGRGVLFGHGSLAGHLAPFEMLNNLQTEGAVFWTTLDWSSPRALLDLIYPAWFFGCTVVASRFEALKTGAAALAARSKITNAMLGQHDLQLVFGDHPRGAGFSHQRLRTVLSPKPVDDLAREQIEALGISINEFHDTIEAGILAVSCGRWFAPKPGSPGRPPPGRSVEVIDVNGAALPPGQVGTIAIRFPDPAIPVGFFADGEIASITTKEGWFESSARGSKDKDGFLFLR